MLLYPKYLRLERVVGLFKVHSLALCLSFSFWEHTRSDKQKQGTCSCTGYLTKVKSMEMWAEGRRSGLREAWSFPLDRTWAARVEWGCLRLKVHHGSKKQPYLPLLWKAGSFELVPLPTSHPKNSGNLQQLPPKQQGHQHWRNIVVGLALLQAAERWNGTKWFSHSKDELSSAITAQPCPDLLAQGPCWFIGVFSSCYAKRIHTVAYHSLKGNHVLPVVQLVNQFIVYCYN